MKFLHTTLFRQRRISLWPIIFGIACSVILSPSFLRINSVEAFAQTTVSCGDSVVLVLKGYKQGSTVWQESFNRTTWSTALGNPYNDSLIFTATNTNYYRAIVTDGTCSPFYSDTLLVSVHPTAKPATGITQTSFIANWVSSGSATDYFLDVALDSDFTSFITGYKNLHIDGVDTISSVVAILCNTTYYYRVRDSSGACGTSVNSNTITVSTDTCPLSIYCTYKSTCNGNITDSRDSKGYKTVQIGTQCWMAQNLNVGLAIPGVVPQTNNTIIEKYCYNYGGTTTDSIKCATYGGLYLWDEMMDYASSKIDAPGPKGICPTGWHLPTDNEWKCLEMTLGMSETEADKNGYHGTTEANKLKTKGNGPPPLWQSPSAGADYSHFSALPSGERNDGGFFFSLGYDAYFWTATEDPASVAISTSLNRILYYDVAQVDRYYGDKAVNGYSVRCVKD